jgi:hypothetical protein
MEDTYKTLIINLKILGQLQKGAKINTYDKYFTIDDDGHLQGALRRLRRDDRTNTYDKISKLVEELSKLNFKDSLLCYSNENIKEILNEAITGLTTLKETYDKDRTFVSKISVEIDILKQLAIDGTDAKFKED